MKQTELAPEAPDPEDPFDLARFVTAQESVYDDALAELRAGRKRTHWMWFIFPQVEGLGFSAMSHRYGITGLDEAQAYLDHPVLGENLTQCAQAILAVDGRSANQIFGSPDDMKLKSSMTLFARAAEPGSVFARVLEKYFSGALDSETLRRIGSSS